VNIYRKANRIFLLSLFFLLCWQRCRVSVASGPPADAAPCPLAAPEPATTPSPAPAVHRFVPRHGRRRRSNSALWPGSLQSRTAPAERNFPCDVRRRGRDEKSSRTYLRCIPVSVLFLRTASIKVHGLKLALP